MTSFAQSETQLADSLARKVDLYVYYQVATELAATLQLRVKNMQQRLRETHGISGALKRRPQEKNGQHTWMEVYLSAPVDFENLLASEVQTAKLAELLTGERHIEHFWDVTSCA